MRELATSAWKDNNAPSSGNRSIASAVGHALTPLFDLNVRLFPPRG
jgi:hypothetical protein